MKTFRIILLLVASVALNAQEAKNTIEGAFGFKLGEKLPEKSIIKKEIMDSGEIKVFYKPEIPVKNLSLHIGNIHPKSEKLYNQTAGAKFEKKEKAEQMYDFFVAALKKKYPNITFDESSTFTGKTAIWIDGERSVTVAIDGFVEHILVVAYRDSKIEEDAKKLILEKKLEESDTSGL